jgi:hypothetical protein
MHLLHNHIAQQLLMLDTTKQVQQIQRCWVHVVPKCPVKARALPACKARSCARDAQAHLVLFHICDPE